MNAEQEEIDRLQLVIAVEVAKKLQSTCLRADCRELRTGTSTFLAADDAGSYCEKHGDAL